MARKDEKVHGKSILHVYRTCENCEAKPIIIENKKYYCAPCALKKAGIRPLTKLMIYEN
tara:strand:- start:2248 stop:2424 length:177 start_codon:yes stop_codon:yes gene_type:complete